MNREKKMKKKLSDAAIAALAMAVLIGALVHPVPSAAQVQLQDPGFPAEERIRYLKTSERGEETVVVELRRPAGGERPHYLYRMSSESKDITAKLSAETLQVYYSDVLEKNRESTVHKINEVVENRKRAGEGELLVTGADALEVSLRGFPWGRCDEAELVFLRDSSEKFSLVLRVKGEETLEINGKSYECRKVQIGLDGFLGRFFPKSHYWYTVSPPHFLVRAEDAGMGGTDESTMEIRSYSAVD